MNRRLILLPRCHRCACRCECRMPVMGRGEVCQPCRTCQHEPEPLFRELPAWSGEPRWRTWMGGAA